MSDPSSTPSPFSPPASAVRDAVPSRFEKRILRALVQFVDDPERRIARNRRIVWICRIIGWIGLVVGFWNAGAASNGPWWTITDPVFGAVMAALGGFFVGMSALYASSVRTWPILSRYLDADRIRADCERAGH